MLVATAARARFGALHSLFDRRIREESNLPFLTYMPLTAYVLWHIICGVDWEIVFHEAFEPEFDELPAEVQDELLAHARVLQTLGPELGRPRVDTLNGSRYPNMKELRFTTEKGVWRLRLTPSGGLLY